MHAGSLTRLDIGLATISIAIDTPIVQYDNTVKNNNT